jgi:uncharacterized repeat protein (TIGR03803 family)
MKSRSVRRIQVLTIVTIILAASATGLHAQTYTVLYNFGGVKCDPLNPTRAGIIAQGRDGNLYSTAGFGSGCAGGGAAFRITPKGKLTVLHSFGNGEQVLTVSGLTLGTDGDYWGTNQGGEFGPGNIFKMTAAGKVTDFNDFGGANGYDPIAPPVQGMDGNFYGTTTEGGLVNGKQLCTYLGGGCGVIYRITPAGKYKVIYTFDQTNGANPAAPLLLGTDGNFYGTTYAGGSIGKTFLNYGVVFRVTPAGKYTVLHAFCSLAGCADGGEPVGGLVQGSDGNFYGTASVGGKGLLGEGVVFKITPGGKYTVLYNFCSLASCKDGDVPYGGLVQATDGNFYGTTVYGGTNNLGTIYQITPKGNHTVLHSFQNTTGSLFGEYPEVTLAQNTNGVLYGDTLGGGTAAKGVFYSIDVGLKPFVSMVAWYGKVGQTIEILGQGLTGTTAVSFNGTAATTFTVVSDTYVTAVVPSGTTAGFVSVTAPAGELTSNRQFRVLPSIVSFSPTSGTVGTQITINGTTFTGATKVTFGGVQATFSVNSDIKITATVPTGAKTGPISVTTPDGTATSSEVFTVTQ